MKNEWECSWCGWLFLLALTQSKEWLKCCLVLPKMFYHGFRNYNKFSIKMITIFGSWDTAEHCTGCCCHEFDTKSKISNKIHDHISLYGSQTVLLWWSARHSCRTAIRKVSRMLHTGRRRYTDEAHRGNKAHFSCLVTNKGTLNIVSHMDFKRSMFRIIFTFI